MLWIPTVGYKDSGKVVKIIEWVWAIIEYKWKNSWMIHISKLSPARVTNVEDIVKMWDTVEFEIIHVDLAKGRVWLQRKPSEEEIKARAGEIFYELTASEEKKALDKASNLDFDDRMLRIGTA